MKGESRNYQSQPSQGLKDVTSTTSVLELQMISETIVRASRIHDVDAICQLIADTIHAVNPDAHVIVSLFDPDVEAIRMRAIAGFEGLIDRSVIAMGIDPRTMTFERSSMGDAAQLYLSGKMEIIDLYDLLNGKVSRLACAAVKRVLGIDHVYTVGFAVGEQPYGGVIILPPIGQHPRYTSAIETLTSHLSEMIQRRQAEKTLRRSEEQFSKAFHSGPLLMTISAVDDGRYIDVNENFVRITGYSRTDAIGTTSVDLGFIAPNDRDMLKQYMLSKGRVEGLELTLTKKSGETFYCLYYGELITVSGERRLLSLGEDITARKMMEKQLQRQERLAAVGQLAAGIAHDFRNLLSTIILYADTPLRHRDLSPALRHNLETIVSESKKAGDLVQQILDFSSQAMIVPQMLDLQDFIQQMLEILKRMIPENIHMSLETRIATPAEQDFTVNADPGRIQQVITNLAINARDAMPAGGELRFILSRITVVPTATPPAAEMTPGTWVCLTISDNGAGMSEEAQQHLFEPFFTTKDVGKGTGLGLAQVYGIIRQHGGAINVETAPNKGTAFNVYLPVAAAADGATTTEENNAILPPGRGETLLLVEDQDTLREALKTVLESLGYHVVTAANGMDAVEVYRSGTKADLVITDIVMPTMGGPAMMAALRQIALGTKVIGMTGYADQSSFRRLEEAGFTAILNKPVDIDKLAQTIHHTLQQT